MNLAERNPGVLVRNIDVFRAVLGHVKKRASLCRRGDSGIAGTLARNLAPAARRRELSDALVADQSGILAAVEQG